MVADEQVCYAINEVANRIVGMDVETIFADMGAFWNLRTFSRPPEPGVQVCNCQVVRADL